MFALFFSFSGLADRLDTAHFHVALLLYFGGAVAKKV
jgi:hypothetical protein